MIEHLYQIGNGFVATPLLLAFHRHEVFSHLSSDLVATERVVRDLRANVGPFTIAVNTLVRLGFLCPSTTDCWAIVSDVNLLNRVPADLPDLLTMDLPSALRLGDSRLKSWIDLSRQRWGFGSDLLHGTLDSFIALPLLQALYDETIVNCSDESRSIIGLSLEWEASIHRSLLAWMEYRGWIVRNQDLTSLTDVGRWFIDNAPLNAAVLSYAPLLSMIEDLLFGNESQVFGSLDHGPEKHISRAQNVQGSGHQHGVFFKSLARALLENSCSALSSPTSLCVVDMGCGDGTLLLEIANSFASNEGRRCQTPQLILVAADASPIALKEASKKLTDANINAHFIRADLSKPDQLMKSLGQINGVRHDQVLHVRSFVDHDRLLCAESSSDIPKWAITVASDAVHLDEFGLAMEESHVLDDLARYFQSWSQHVGPLGLLVLEVHSLSHEFVSQHPTLTNAIHYEVIHGLSRQHLITARQYLLAAAVGRLIPRHDFPVLFPKGRSQPQFSLTWFDSVSASIRLAESEDFDQLLRLEELTWPEPLRKPATEIHERIGQGQQDVFVAVSSGRIVGAIYTQRISAIEDLFALTSTDFAKLQSITGSITVIFGMSVLPEYAAEGLGAVFIRFINALSRVTPGLEELVGISRVHDRKIDSGESLMAYVMSRGPAGGHRDSVLRFHQSNGAEIFGLVPEFRAKDDISSGAGVLVRYPLGESRQSTFLVPHNSTSAEVKWSDQILGHISDICGEQLSPASVNCEFRSLPLDSLDFQELRLRLERQIGKQFGRNIFLQFQTPSLLGDEIHRQYGDEAFVLREPSVRSVGEPFTTALIRRANAEDAVDAYRLRYKAFLRRGDERYLNHSTKEHRDVLDGVPGSHLLIAVDSVGEVVGTCRLVERSQCEFISDYLYSWEALAGLLACDVQSLKTNALLIDRAAISESHRTSGLFDGFIDNAIDEALNLNKNVLITTTAANNVQMQRSLLSMGFVMYGAGRAGTFRGLNFVRQVTTGS